MTQTFTLALTWLLNSTATLSDASAVAPSSATVLPVFSVGMYM